MIGHIVYDMEGSMVLVTGCNSLIGRTLIAKLLQDGQQVKVIDMWKDSKLPEAATFYQSNLLDIDSIEEAMDDVDTVFHLMDVEDASYYGRRFMKKVNIKGTENLLKVAVDKKINHFVFLSSGKVYGNPDTMPIKEDDPLKPNTAYGKDKVKAEKLCLQFAEEGLPITIIRPTIITGPGVDDAMILIILYMALAMDDSNRLYIAGDGDSRYQLVHPDDVVAALLAIKNKQISKGKIYNIGSDNVPTQLEQVVKVKEIAQLDCQIKHITPFFTRVLSVLLKPLNIHYLRKDHVQFILSNFVLDCNKIKEELNWVPQKTNIEIWAETIEWYRREKL